MLILIFACKSDVGRGGTYGSGLRTTILLGLLQISKGLLRHFFQPWPSSYHIKAKYEDYPTNSLDSSMETVECQSSLMLQLILSFTCLYFRTNRSTIIVRIKGKFGQDSAETSRKKKHYQILNNIKNYRIIQVKSVNFETYTKKMNTEKHWRQK